MKRLPVLIFLFLALCGCQPEFRSSGDLTDEILRVAALGEAKLYGAKIRTEDYRGLVMELSNELSPLTVGKSDIDTLAGIMNKFIFEQAGFSADSGTGRSPERFNRFLKEKNGTCLMLTGLFLCLSDHLNLPLEAILLPGHIYVRIRDKDNIRNIETLRRGIGRSNDFYLSFFKMNEHSATYFNRPLLHREVAGLFWFNLANAFAERGLWEDAESAYQACMERFPDYAEAYMNLGNCLVRQRKPKAASVMYRRAAELRPDWKDKVAHLIQRRG